MARLSRVRTTGAQASVVPCAVRARGLATRCAIKRHLPSSSRHAASRMVDCAAHKKRNFEKPAQLSSNSSASRVTNLSGGKLDPKHIPAASAGPRSSPVPTASHPETSDRKKGSEKDQDNLYSEEAIEKALAEAAEIDNKQGSTVELASELTVPIDWQKRTQRLEPLDPNRHLNLETIDEEPEEKLVYGESVKSYQRPKKHRRKPGNFFALAARNFIVEFKGLIVYTLERIARPEDLEKELPTVFNFTLDNDAIHAFDVEHPSPGREPVPVGIQVMYDILLYFVDEVYEGKAIERFWFLETVARMPYFSFSTCLHLYETMGWWRTGGLRVVHFAEEWNELHHLLIMEALGGDRKWVDRFLAGHAAVFYFWALIVAFVVSPKWSYKFSEMLETHAVSTYRQFLIENADKLKELPAPLIARKYYLSDDPYMYNMDSALVRGPNQIPPRTPPCATLFDVFTNILEDEWEHVKTMVMCQDYPTLETLNVSQTEFNLDKVPENRRELWNQWAKDINEMDDMMDSRKWAAFAEVPKKEA